MWQTLLMLHTLHHSARWHLAASDSLLVLLHRLAGLLMGHSLLLLLLLLLSLLLLLLLKQHLPLLLLLRRQPARWDSFRVHRARFLMIEEGLEKLDLEVKKPTNS